MKYTLGDRTPVLEGEQHFIADGARVIGRVRLKTHSSVWFNAVLRGDNSLIGIGSTILNGAVIAENCMVGAHALITENKTFPPGSLNIGAPARVARELSEEEIASISEAAERYVDNAARYCARLKAID